MNAPIRITADLDEATFALVQTAARAQGRTADEFAAAAIRGAAERDADLEAALRRGAEAFERGDYLTHDELVADIARWKQGRKPAA